MQRRWVAVVIAMSACGPTPKKPDPVPEPIVIAPAPSCDQMTLDLFAGTINGVPLTASQDEVKTALPCSTGESPDGDAVFNYGGGVFFLDHQLFVYTGRDFIQVRSGFVGVVTPPLLGAPPSAASAELGTPEFDTGAAQYFDHAPGCIVITYDDTTITETSTHRATCLEARQMFEEM